MNSTIMSGSRQVNSIPSERQKQYPAWKEDFVFILEEHGKLIGELKDRLSPILSPSDEINPKDAELKVKPVPLVEELNQFSSRIREQNSILRSMITRLEF